LNESLEFFSLDASGVDSVLKHPFSQSDSSYECLGLYFHSEIIHFDATVCARPGFRLERVEGEYSLIQKNYWQSLLLCFIKITDYAIKPCSVLRILEVDNLFDSLDELEPDVMLLVKPLDR